MIDGLNDNTLRETSTITPEETPAPPTGPMDKVDQLAQYLIPQLKKMQMVLGQLAQGNDSANIGLAALQTLILERNKEFYQALTSLKAILSTRDLQAKDIVDILDKIIITDEGLEAAQKKIIDKIQAQIAEQNKELAARKAGLVLPGDKGFTPPPMRR